jgi:amino acid transporter
MAAHAGDSHVLAAAAHEGPGLLFTLGGGALSQAAQVLFLTSLFAAALAFHNTCWRYMFALAREGVLPGALAHTGGNNIPRTASLVQSATGLATIAIFALAGWPPMQVMFFWLGTTGGFGILILLAVTAVAVIVFFHADPRGEPTWARITAPALAAMLLACIVVLALWHYNTLLGVAPGSIAAWAFPAAYAAVAATGIGWGLALRSRRPHVYATIGLGAHAVTGQATLTSSDAR